MRAAPVQSISCRAHGHGQASAMGQDHKRILVSLRRGGFNDPTLHHFSRLLARILTMLTKWEIHGVMAQLGENRGRLQWPTSASITSIRAGQCSSHPGLQPSRPGIRRWRPADSLSFALPREESRWCCPDAAPAD